MREILFRGKRTDNGEWIYGDLMQNVNCIKIREQEKDVKHIAKSFEIDLETVGQYTDLTDKNGKRIFEGDILLLDDINGIVNYGTGCFCVKLSGPDYLYHNNPAIDIVLYEYPGLEVIGNIYDTPEPLKGGEG